MEIMPGPMTRSYGFDVESVSAPDKYVELGVIGNGKFGSNKRISNIFFSP